MVQNIEYPERFNHHKYKDYYPDLIKSYRYLYELYIKKGINPNTARLGAEAAFIDASKFRINKINEKYQDLKPWLKSDDDNIVRFHNINTLEMTIELLKIILKRA